ncbi:hypothetical protein [Streptomyces physcomitrii]|uniref:Secreted protein n=1 Tax=Streptomyces physcomitrii TaxID=2724184 RepID=A0ABX1H1Y3_9ACTN|nr:hypothetical protein [Streptomyces physcomitrii]NKI42350.1 hypothetical protein [Streptomyces physcomitrii]
MASQIITLVGVLLGAVTSFFATSWAERAKFRQTLATRWDERKFNTYIEYISCVKEATRAAKRAIRAHEQGGDATEPLSEMEAAEDRRSVLFEGLVLLGDDAASRAAVSVNERLWDLLNCAREPDGVSVNDRDGLGPSIIDALNSLHKAARTDLAIGDPES